MVTYRFSLLALTGIGWHSELCSETRPLEMFLNPCTDFHGRIIPVYNAVLPKALKITDI